MTTVYLIRHSEKLKNTINIDNDDGFQVSNEKIVLSSEGEEKAKKLSECSELKNLDAVFASTYARSISTAKYIAYANNTNIRILKGFGERVYGINSLDEIVSDFEIKQYEDEDYKVGYGESRKEVTDRIYNTLLNVLSSYKDKRIAIISHGTAICFLLTKWCDVLLSKDESNKLITNIKFNDKVIFNNDMAAPEMFKLIFDDNFDLVDIENIKY